MLGISMGATVSLATQGLRSEFHSRETKSTDQTDRISLLLSGILHLVMKITRGISHSKLAWFPQNHIIKANASIKAYNKKFIP